MSKTVKEIGFVLSPGIEVEEYQTYVELFFDDLPSVDVWKPDERTGEVTSIGVNSGTVSPKEARTLANLLNIAADLAEAFENAEGK